MLGKLLSLRVSTLIGIVIIIAIAGVVISQVLPEDEEQAGRVEVSFMIFGDPAEKAAYEQLVVAFEERYPDIDVVLIHIPGQGDYRRRLGTDFAAGTPTDVVLINYRRYAPFADSGVLEPLGPYLDESELIQESDFFPQTTEPFYWNDTLMCIPQNISSLVVYYNKDLFNAADVDYPADDWTWDDFLATAQALTFDMDGDGETDQYGLGIDPFFFRLIPFIWQQGGEVVDDYENPTRLTLDTPETRAAIEWYVSLQVEHQVVPTRLAEQVEESDFRFMRGRLGMYLSSRRSVPTYREYAYFNWDVAPLPRNVQTAGILHSDAYCMTRIADNKDAVWTFIEFANGPEGQAIVAQSGRTVPSLISVANSPAFLDGIPVSSHVWLDTARYLRGVPVMANWVDIEIIAGEELERVYYGDVSIDEFIATATERTQPFFNNEP